MTEEQAEAILRGINELIRLQKESDSSKACKIRPYLFRIEVNWKTILATCIALLTLLDNLRRIP